MKDLPQFSPGGRYLETGEEIWRWLILGIESEGEAGFGRSTPLRSGRVAPKVKVGAEGNVRI